MTQLELLIQAHEAQEEKGNLTATGISYLDGLRTAQKIFKENFVSKEDMKFVATRFAHQCRLNAIISSHETITLYDNWIKDFKYEG